MNEGEKLRVYDRNWRVLQKGRSLTDLGPKMCQFDGQGLTYGKEGDYLPFRYGYQQWWLLKATEPAKEPA